MCSSFRQSKPGCMSRLILLVILRSRSKTRRSMGRPLGDDQVLSVKQGNLLTVRTLVLALVCSAKGVYWILEQPSGSLLEEHPLFQWLIRRIPVYRTSLQMKTYGHWADKPTWLYSSRLLRMFRWHSNIYIVFYQNLGFLGPL